MSSLPASALPFRSGLSVPTKVRSMLWYYNNVKRKLIVGNGGLHELLTYMFDMFAYLHGIYARFLLL